NEQVEIAVIVIVLPRPCDSGTAVCDNAPSGNLGESAIAVVVIKIIMVGEGIEAAGCHEKVQEAVVVIVAPCRSYRLCSVSIKWRTMDLTKGAISIIVKEPVVPTS